MYQLAKPLIFISATPSHVGAGTDLGVVDLPIQRERYTGFPKYEASSVKGSLKDAFYALAAKSKEDVADRAELQHPNGRFDKINKQMIEDVFGKDEQADHASAIAFTDARILLFPVKSLKHVFVWITCPQILSRFKQEMQLCGIDLSTYDHNLEGTIPQGSDLIISGQGVLLEEYLVNVQQSDECAKWANWFSEHLFPSSDEYQYWRNKLTRDLVIVPDDVFRDFVMLSTDIVTRVRIDRSKGIVKEGALFTEEYLPAESVLYSLVMASPVLKSKDEGLYDERFASAQGVIDFFAQFLPRVIQIGGNETIGKGITRTHLIEDGRKQTIEV
ncbi:type III-B CRISPR module RAMP protein Cmr4 [Geobacillus icigianus]|uniref:Type III-B CRISPR module RAMP protein Cmr4 n=1 Tax=Geobacillus subterraneus TaxID=129338 RepID=A0A679FQ97_9BACL|nr:type III-B CRISPR module RAMP protein Cmr4 [Geobacillus subterraneus]BBW96407.1 type III-B CRISPR module RAMP protein Cmr4 [Geobacillus subterraneus]